MEKNQFTVGGLIFEAVRFTRPAPHWRLKLPGGVILEDGAGGFSGESKPKMKADLEYYLRRFGSERFKKELDPEK